MSEPWQFGRTAAHLPPWSSAGEAVGFAEVDARGFVGDRWYAVEDDEGRFASGKDSRRFRRRDPVFCYSASTDSGGHVVVTRGDERWLVGDPRLDQRLTEDMGTRQDGAEPGEKWLRPLAQECDMFLAVYADVTHPGRVTVGDRVRAI